MREYDQRKSNPTKSKISAKHIPERSEVAAPVPSLEDVGDDCSAISIEDSGGEGSGARGGVRGGARGGGGSRGE